MEDTPKTKKPTKKRPKRPAVRKKLNSKAKPLKAEDKAEPVQNGWDDVEPPVPDNPEQTVKGSVHSRDKKGKAKVIEVGTGYKPRELQQCIHNNRKRFNVLAIHRRFGKTVLAINEIIHQALLCSLDRPQYAYIAPTFRQAKTVAWTYVKEFTRNIPNVQVWESELKIQLPNKATIQLLGAENYDSIRGMYFDGCVMDEFGLQNPAVWTEVIRPALSDRLGWCMFLGTPNGKNHFHEIYHRGLKRMKNGEDWYCATFRADETHIIDAKELEQARNEMPESDFRQEFLCDWSASVKGSYFSNEMTRLKEDGRITRVPHSDSLPVFACFDLGIADATAIWLVQLYRQEVRIINYLEYTDTGFFDVLLEVERECRSYDIAELWLPHDAGKREQSSAKSLRDMLEDKGWTIEIAPKTSLRDGIFSARMFMSQCWFDKDNTPRGIDCLDNYRKKIDQRTKEFLEQPQHDEYSHGADAFRYLALVYNSRYGDEGVKYKQTKRGQKEHFYQPKVKRAGHY